MSWYEELLTTDIGLLSLGTILFIIVMAIYIYRFLVQRMDEDEARAKENEQK